MSNTDTTTLARPEHKRVIVQLGRAGWTLTYPEWVRETLAKALQTDELPPYCVEQVNKAIRVAATINRRLNTQAEEAEKHAAAKEGGVKKNHNAKKAEKRAYDADLRARMKGHNAQPAKYGKK